MRYTDPGGEEHNCAVGVKDLGAAVGAFDESRERDAVVEGIVGFAVEMFGEAGAAADD